MGLGSMLAELRDIGAEFLQEAREGDALSMLMVGFFALIIPALIALSPVFLVIGCFGWAVARVFGRKEDS